MHVRKGPIFALLLATFAAFVIGWDASPARAFDPPGARDPVLPGEIIVGLKPGVSIKSVAGAAGATGVRPLGGGGAYLLQLDGDSRERAADVRRLPGVGYAEPNRVRSLHGPNDADYDLKWDLNNLGVLCNGSGCATANADMDWEEAYTGVSVTGSAVIAVLDTGVDSGHPDLNGKLVPGYDFFDGDPDPTDDYAHGTHVIGIAAAETNNATGTAGVAWLGSVTVMPVKVCGWVDTLFGTMYGCPIDAIVSGVYHAVNNGADVINLSLGGSSRSKAEQNAIKDAWNAGLVIAAASGNDYSDSKVSYPGAFKEAIAVGATDWNDVRAPYSNGGKDLDVTAPGGRMDVYHDPGGIYSTMPTYEVYLTTGEPGDPLFYSLDYDQLQGTSMATPQVAGLAALLIAKGFTNGDVRTIIESTADDLGDPGWDNFYGHGRINVDAALSATAPPSEPPPDGGDMSEPNCPPKSNKPACR
jgi:subtilisin family serine protease